MPRPLTFSNSKAPVPAASPVAPPVVSTPAPAPIIAPSKAADPASPKESSVVVTRIDGPNAVTAEIDGRETKIRLPVNRIEPVKVGDRIKVIVLEGIARLQIR